VALRRSRGFLANPWLAGSRFLISHNLLTDETYVAGLRQALGEFRPRSLLILDEAHHAAPSSGARYAVDSQFTRSMDDLAGRFEHRLFLSATPHNGHPNSFSRLLAMLDPQRFTRGVPVEPSDLDPIMVRRLKSDLRLVGEQFPERVVEAIHLRGLPPDAPELVLAKMLKRYSEMRSNRLAHSPAAEAAHGRLAFVGLQQRLLSSIAAFAGTLRVHRTSLAKRARAAAEAAAVFTAGAPLQEDEAIDEAATEQALQLEEDAATEAATAIGAIGATDQELAAELALVDEMLVIAEQHKDRADARVTWLETWVRTNMASGGKWNGRRLVLFTEWEATRRWLQRRLRIALADLDLDTPSGPRIGVFTGVTTQDRRETLKRACKAAPETEPLRILICTDAAREGINLQSRCHDLIHVDLPWNPARLEQRNGRIDRKLQPSPKVWCLHFIFDQREEDIVLDALVRKTERIRTQLGSVGQVIGDRIAERMSRDGIRNSQQLAAAVEAEQADERDQRARKDLDDENERRQARLKRELDDLRHVLGTSKERVGVEASELQATVNAALVRAHGWLAGTEVGVAGDASLFKLDPPHHRSTNPAGGTPSTICATGAVVAVSGLPSGAQPVRSVPRPSARRHCRTAPRPQASCSCTWSTASSAACCRGSLVRDFSQGFSVCASSLARPRSHALSSSAASPCMVRVPRVCTRRSYRSPRRGSRRHATMRRCGPLATVGRKLPCPSLMQRCVTRATRRPMRLSVPGRGRERMQRILPPSLTAEPTRRRRRPGRR
jgi:hypothetical protein